MGKEPLKYKISKEPGQEHVQKNRYIEERVVNVKSDSSYSYSAEKVEGGFRFSDCERRGSDGKVEKIIHYAYVPKEEAEDLYKKLRRLPKDKPLRVSKGRKLIDNLRDGNYKDSNGVMVYVTPDGTDILRSSASTGRPSISPRYVPGGEKNPAQKPPIKEGQ